MVHQGPFSFSIWSHLIGDTAQHCGLTERQLAVIPCVWLSHGEACVGRKVVNPSRHLTPPRPPLWPGSLVLRAAACTSYRRPLGFMDLPSQSIQHSRSSGLVQVLRWDQRLSVLLLTDGKHWHTDVITLTRKSAPLSGLATLILRLGGGRRARAGLRCGSLDRRNHRCLCCVCCPGEQTKTGTSEPWPSEIAGGVEATLPLGGLGEWVRGVADGRVRDGAVVCVGLQVIIREDLPADIPPAVGDQAGRSLKGKYMVCLQCKVLHRHF